MNLRASHGGLVPLQCFEAVLSRVEAGAIVISESCFGKKCPKVSSV